jgi:putative transposase
MSSNYPKIQPGNFAHICNRGVGDELLFRRNADYEDFLSRIIKYIIPVAEIHSFCLMPNHYHLIIRTFDTTEHSLIKSQLSKLESTYAKFYNRSYGRRGSLFMRPFKRIIINSDAQLIWAFWYVHRNPMHHGITMNWKEWPYSSYSMFFQNEPSFLVTNFMLDIFGGLKGLSDHHQLNSDAFRLDLRNFGLE